MTKREWVALATGATAVALLLSMALAWGCYASTVPIYTPGGAPCRGVCSYSWALQQTNAPAGEVAPVTVQRGWLIVGMAYAHAGQPRWTGNPMVVGEDLTGRGYWFTKDGQTYLLVQLDACQNWALVIPTAAPATLPSYTVLPLYELAAPPAVPLIFDALYSCCCDGATVPPADFPRVPYVPLDPPKPPVPSVPLPASGLLLAAAFILFIKRFHHAT